MARTKSQVRPNFVVPLVMMASIERAYENNHHLTRLQDDLYYYQLITHHDAQDLVLEQSKLAKMMTSIKSWLNQKTRAYAEIIIRQSEDRDLKTFKVDAF